MLFRLPCRKEAPRLSPDEIQERLFNFGDGMAERAIRSWFGKDALAAAAFPDPRGI